jgi:glycosyltransferase involved in cell wall biosynthesis
MNINSENNTVGADVPIKISFCLFTYNQSEYVYEALQSALAQNYSPMQIVIIDDGSLDGTSAIIEKEVSNYSGPHQTKVLLKKKNKGLADSINTAIYDLADGEWLVFAAGDDISFKDRTLKIANMAMSNPTLTLIQSGVIRVNADGEFLNNIHAPILSLEATFKESVLGAAAAYHKPTIASFPQMGMRVIREDAVLTARALISGKYARLDECLVKWRRHKNNMSGTTGQSFFESLLFVNGKFLNDHSIALAQQMSDTIHAMMRGIIDDKKSAWLLLCYSKMIFKNQKRSGFFLALQDGKTSIGKYMRRHPFHSIYALVFISYQYARHKAYNFRN